MKFPNAAKGVKKIYTAEILTLLAYIFLAVGVVMLIVGAATGTMAQTDAQEVGSVLSLGGAMIFIAAFGVLALISFIMYLVGLINASHDESSFQSALILLIIQMVLLGVSAANFNPTLTNTLYSAASLVELFTTIFVVAGIVKLADRLNRGDISAKGSNVLKLILVINVLAIVASIVVIFLGSITASVAAGVLLLISVVLDIVKYFMYLSLLKGAKKMLAKS